MSPQPQPPPPPQPGALCNTRKMKKLGFKFVGPVTIYSFLQAVGLINDHIDSCSFKDGGR